MFAKLDRWQPSASGWSRLVGCTLRAAAPAATTADAASASTAARIPNALRMAVGAQAYGSSALAAARAPRRSAAQRRALRRRAHRPASVDDVAARVLVGQPRGRAVLVDAGLGVVADAVRERLAQRRPLGVGE